MPTEGRKLSEMMLMGPDEDLEAIEESGNEQGREDRLQAFADFTNDALPADERADALAFFVELVQASGPTLDDDIE